MTVPCDFARVLVELTNPDGAVTTFTFEHPEWTELDVSAPMPALTAPNGSLFEFGAPSPGSLSLTVRAGSGRPMTSEARAAALPAGKTVHVLLCRIELEGDGLEGVYSTPGRAEEARAQAAVDREGGATSFPVQAVVLDAEPGNYR